MVPLPGVTKYKAVRKYQETQFEDDTDVELRRNLLKMTKVFQPSLFEMLTRQETINEYCVPNSLHPHAAALGKLLVLPCVEPLLLHNI